MQAKQLMTATLATIMVLMGSTANAGLFNIEIDYLGGLTDSQVAVFADAENFWETHLTGITYDGADLTTTISAEGSFIDGAGGTLGQAGPTSAFNTGTFLYADAGIMNFDSADLAQLEADGDLFAVLLHEMAHVLGFGTLWESAGAYLWGTGQYTGAHGLAAYQAEFDPLATYVPVELGGGSGTANAHWDEEWAGGVNELMTGFFDAPTFISNTTIASFGDLGFTYQLFGESEPVPESGISVPEPGSVGLLLAGITLLMLVRRRRECNPELAVSF